MVNIELTAEEAAILKTHLERVVSDKRMEISGTDSDDYRESLKAEEAILQKIIGMLGGMPSAM